MRALAWVFLVVGVRATATATLLPYAFFQGGISGAGWCWSCAFAVSFGDDFVTHDAVSLEKERQSTGLAEKMKPLILTEVAMPLAQKIASQLQHPTSQSQRRHLAVRVVPGAARTAVVGMLGDAVKIRVAAAPADGAANRALCVWLKKTLGAQDVQVLAGGSGRSKLLALDFADAAPGLEELQQSLLPLTEKGMKTVKPLIKPA